MRRGGLVAPALFTRKSANGGNTYTRFAMGDPIDARQRQRLHGWYDELDEGGGLERTHDSMHWRRVFRYELELMLGEAGLEIACIEGGHQGEALSGQSPRMFIQARRAEEASLA